MAACDQAGHSSKIERMSEGVLSGADSGASGVAGAAVGALEAGVDALLSLDVSCLSDEAVLEVLRRVETQLRRVGAGDHALIAEVESRGLAAARGCASTAALLRGVLRVSPAQARRRVHAAADLGCRRSLTGQLLPPIFPAVAQAVAQGAISDQHAHLITKTIDELPAAVQADYDTAVEQTLVEQTLVEQALTLDPTQLAHLARGVADRLDPDGTLNTEADRARRRGLTLTRRADGSAHIEGELTSACTEALLSVLDTAARPAPAADGPTAADDGARDPRSPAQRRHDGLLDALLLTLRSGRLPQAGGVTTTIILTMTLEQVENRAGLVSTGHGSLISMEQALTLATDTRLIPVIFTGVKRVAAYGTTHRIFTEGQRLAMIARDQGCTFPGCDTPPAWCQAHHVTDYALGGPTTTDNGTLLCGYHHREHHNLGWTCHMSDSHPTWTPPPWIDPHQTPRHNHAHTPELVPI